jgi:hypothetical protein
VALDRNLCGNDQVPVLRPENQSSIVTTQKYLHTLPEADQTAVDV